MSHCQRALITLIVAIGLNWLNGCSTVRLTPRAADRLKQPNYLVTMATDVQSNATALDAAKKQLAEQLRKERDAADELRTLQGAKANPQASIEFNHQFAQARIEIDGDNAVQYFNFLGKSSQARSVSFTPSKHSHSLLAEIESLEWEQDRLIKDQATLRKVDLGKYEYFVEGSLYFSIEPAVALRPGIEAVAVPSLGMNYRPIAPGHPLSAMALQFLLGGALNPSDDGSSTSGAIGFGFSYPIAGSGAISSGVIFWDDSGESRSAPYISVTLGDFAKRVGG